MKLALTIAAVTAMGGCTLVIAESASFYGEDFEAEIRPTSNVGCPATLVAGGSSTVAVLEDSVVVDGRVFPADVESPENGVSRVEFTMAAQWSVDGRSVTVSILFRGSARSDALDFIGTMSSSAPELAGCRVDVELLGRLPADRGD
ncbi:MAG: hypothetical protein ACKV2T_05340 [Kofleriaceae bacterium]